MAIGKVEKEKDKRPDEETRERESVPCLDALTARPSCRTSSPVPA